MPTMAVVFKIHAKSVLAMHGHVMTLSCVDAQGQVHVGHMW